MINRYITAPRDTRWCPSSSSRVQLVNISTTFHVWVDEWGLFLCRIHGDYKPPYNWGGYHLVNHDKLLNHWDILRQNGTNRYVDNMINR